MHIQFELQFFLRRPDDNEEKIEGKAQKIRPSGSPVW